MIALFALLLALAGAPAPALIDQTGHAFTLDSLRGRPLIVTFVSAHCTDACPLVNAQFSDAAQTIAKRKLDARLLTITLDPQHDSPSLMSALAHRFDADPRYWLVASGRPNDVDSILRRFGVIAITGKNGYREEHSTFVYVVDRDGRLQKTMLASTNLNADVVDAIEGLRVAKR
ncbi:MAG: SCO family protein [Candidatus Eremiobacteraeota bacterium]|nr:SCO family protein [Candidatus Eremiobacteraeota bacterium]